MSVRLGLRTASGLPVAARAMRCTTRIATRFSACKSRLHLGNTIWIQIDARHEELYSSRAPKRTVRRRMPEPRVESPDVRSGPLSGTKQINQISRVQVVVIARSPPLIPPGAIHMTFVAIAAAVAEHVELRTVRMLLEGGHGGPRAAGRSGGRARRLCRWMDEL